MTEGNESALIKRTENNEYLFESIFNKIRSGIVIYQITDDGKDFIIKDMNPAAEKYEQLIKENVIGKNLTDIFPEVKSFGLFDILQSVNMTGIPQTLPLKEYSDGRIQGWKENYVFRLPSGALAVVYDDLTESRQREQILRDRNEEHEAILQTAINGFVNLDKSGRILYVNEAYCRMLGYSKDELCAMSIKDLETIETHEEVTLHIAKAIQQKFDLFETRQRKKNGSFVDVEINCVWNSNLDKFYVFVRELTETKRILKELSNKTELIESFFNYAIDLFCIADKFGHFLKLNKEWERTLGFSLEELESTKYLDFIHPDDLQLTMAAMKDLAENKPVINFVNRYRTSDNQYKYIEWKTFPYGDLIYASARDITFQKKIENDLKESENRLFQILNKMPAGIMLIDENGFISFKNKKLMELFGFDKENIPTIKDFFKITCIDSQEGKLYMNMWHKKYSPSGTNPKAGGKLEFKLKHKNGSLKYIHMNGIAFGIDTLCTLVDTTERYQYEIELKKAKEQAESANKSKSSFIANISHEIRTPLNAVIGFTELLKTTSLSTTQKQYLENANSSALMLLEILNDILDLSKIEAGKLTLDPHETDLMAVIESAIDMTSLVASQKGLELLLNISPFFPDKFFIDSLRIQQILINLLNNAVKFTMSGEVELKVDFVPLNKEFGEITFSIKDTGIGIDEFESKNLFKAFSQADTSTTRMFGGTGLGLVISNLLAEKMGSKISFASEKNKGSTFYFTIKVKYFQKTTEKQKPIHNIKNALIVDDNESSRKSIARTLSYFEITSTECDNGYKAIKTIEESRCFDLVLIDYSMPYLDGIETIRKINTITAKCSRKPEVFLLYTIADEVEILQISAQFGLKNRLTKPLKISKFSSFLNQLSENDNHTEYVAESKVEDAVTNGNSLIILIADDIAVNTMIISSLIKRILKNTTLIEAKNGKEAFDMALLHKPDLILMDIQMPIMDGIEATRKIREEENSFDKRPVIVALTACSGNKDSDRFIKAGMDDFILKPIKVDNIENLLKKYFSESFCEDVNPNMNVSADKHFLISELLKEFGGNKEFISGLIREAKNTFPEKVRTLGEALAEKNEEKLKIIAHAIKGTAASLKFERLSQLAAEIEHASDSKPFNLTKLFNELSTEWNTIEQLLDIWQ